MTIEDKLLYGSIIGYSLGLTKLSYDKYIRNIESSSQTKFYTECSKSLLKGVAIGMGIKALVIGATIGGIAAGLVIGSVHQPEISSIITTMSDELKKGQTTL